MNPIKTQVLNENSSLLHLETCEYFTEPFNWVDAPKVCYYCVFWNYEGNFCFINDKDIRLIRFKKAAKTKNQRLLEVS